LTEEGNGGQKAETGPRIPQVDNGMITALQNPPGPVYPDLILIPGKANSQLLQGRGRDTGVIGPEDPVEGTGTPGKAGSDQGTVAIAFGSGSPDGDIDRP